MLVGEGRKYQTVEQLAKAYMQADEFIETLKGENSQLREEVQKGATLDDVMKRLEAKPSGGTDQSAKTTQSGLSAEQVVSIVRAQLTGLETERTQQANLVKADAELKKLFGEKAKEMFEREAPTPELKKALMSLASVSPEKFVALFVPKGQQQTTDNSTSVNTAALQGAAASGREADPTCKEFYDNLRRKEPRKYYSQAVQIQMNKAAVANPNKFFGR